MTGVVFEVRQGYKSKDQRHDERGAEVEVVDWYNRLEIKDKQSWDKGESIWNDLDSEQRPAYSDYHESDDDTGNFSDFFVEFVEAHALQYEPETMIRAP